MPTRKLFAIAVLAVSCAGSLLAQPQTPAPVQSPAVTQPTPTIPAAAQPQLPPAPPPQVPTTAPTPMPTATPMAESEHGTAVLLLDRIQRVLDKAAEEESEAVTLDRGLVDEMRAELTQIKMTLQRPKQP